MSDRFGLIYAKRTQFRVAEAATLEGWRCRLVARNWVARFSRFPDISRQFTAHLFRQWIPNSRRCQHFCPRSGRFVGLNSAFLDFSRQFKAHLFSPWIPSSARHRRPRRFTEVVLNEEPLPVAYTLRGHE